MLHVWQTCLATLGLEDRQIARYSLRHAGASNDVLKNLRPVEDIKARGRWKTDSSMRRYTRAARAQQFANQLPEPILTYGRQIREMLPGILNGTVAPIPPPQ